jgi:hypothetical protein
VEAITVGPITRHGTSSCGLTTRKVPINYWREQVRDSWERHHDKDATVYEISKQLKSEHEDNTPTVTGVYADLLNAALSEVNWYEIAEAMIDGEEFEDNEELTEDGAQV